ncbi:type III PLP-dependent enzyme [Mangrovimicrobium sediminis]|uniref:ornithine decarboxylase n=1 Tax=Mangrovimicrobium sediminis TaxID=2562682 RepID=A0A4Z0M5D6_9GAMM|nr:type III PLP-dependent enzyme [Haliea sp. SAOS-164]TGD74701.1 type III PLP-dependent enzyme [Haliea sp. SAOS-164]
MTGSPAQRFHYPQQAAPYRNSAEITGRVKPVEPLYLFCADQLEQRARRFLEGFPGMVSYAVKANPEYRVLATLHSCGVRNFDVASLEEVITVAAACPGAVLHFNNPIKAEEAVREAYLRFGVRSFALDEMAELEKIHRCTDGDRDVIYAVRFKLAHAGAAYDFGSKFGADEPAAVALLTELRRRGLRAALTFHPGSQCTDPTMYARYVEAGARIAQRADTPLEFLNVGGGFPEYYLNTAPPSLETYFGQVHRAARGAFGDGVPLLCEPGRAMVAPSVSLLARIVHCREDGQTVFINDGVYGGMQEQSLVDLQLPVRAWRDGAAVAGEHTHYRVFGPTCDPIDRLQRTVSLPRGLRPGDYLEFGLLGAYGSATSTRFNGFQSAAYVDIREGTDFDPA